MLPARGSDIGHARGIALDRSLAAVATRRLAVIVLLLGGARPADADPAHDVRIDSLEPAVTDSALVCTVHMRGLPDDASRDTLASGLPSALVVAFSLIDGRGGERDMTRVEVRIEPDLWEGNLVLRTPFVDRRLDSMDDVAEQLAHLGPLPVQTLVGLESTATWRIRVRLAIHPLAPTEKRRVADIFSGQSDGAGTNRHESSVPLGALVRHFLGRAQRESWVAEAVSSPFTYRGLHMLTRAPVDR